ncbi:MAG: hypothetical protein ABIA74_01370 [bacterium]
MMIYFRRILFCISFFSLSFFNVFADDVEDFRSAVNDLNVDQVRSILKTKKDNSSDDDFFEFVNHPDKNGNTVLHLLADLAIEKEGWKWNSDRNDEEEVIGFEKTVEPKPESLKKINKIIIILLENDASKYAENNNEETPENIIETPFLPASREYKEIQSLLKISRLEILRDLSIGYFYDLWKYFFPEK